MFNNVIVPHYAEEHNDHTRGSVLSYEKLLDSHKELRDIGDGLYRISVYRPKDEQTEWDFEEFSDLTEAQEVFASIDSYDDLNNRHQL